MDSSHPAPARATPPGGMSLVTRVGMCATLLSACGPADCPKGSVRNLADGLCYLIDDAEAAGEAPPADDTPDTGTDSAAPPIDEPVEVADHCDPPETLPADPITPLGSYFLQSEAFAEAVDIEVDPTTGLAVLSGQSGLMVVDISDPANPAWVGHHGASTFRERYQNLELGPGGLVYATHWDEGLVVYDILTGADPTLAFSLEAEGLAGLARHDSWLYIVDRATGTLGVWDISRPDAPALVSSTPGLSAPYAPFLHGDHLYIADNTEGIVVYDVSTAGSPTRVATIAADASIQDLAFSSDGTTLYAAAGGAGIQVYALDNPEAPVLVDTLAVAHSVISVSVGDGLLWAVDQQDVLAIDISTPRVPVVLNTHRTGQWSMHVAAVGQQAWVADWGYLRGYEASGIPVADLHPSTSQVYLASAGATATVQLANSGGEDLLVTGIEVDDSRVSWTLADGRIPPGTSRPLTLEYAGEGPLDATVCIASNDPDTPRQQVAVVADTAGGRAGVGVEAPDFELSDLDGNAWRLSDLRGRPVVLAYFATW
jgi:hypothetical protein